MPAGELRQLPNGQQIHYVPPFPSAALRPPRSIAGDASATSLDFKSQIGAAAAAQRSPAASRSTSVQQTSRTEPNQDLAAYSDSSRRNISIHGTREESKRDCAEVERERELPTILVDGILSARKIRTSNDAGHTR